MRARTARLITTSALALGIFVSAAPAAQADHHLMSIREFYPGTTAATRDDAFLELQMYSAGQQFVGGHDIDVYGPGADMTPDTYTLATMPTLLGDNQRTVLAGGPNVADRDRSEDIGNSVDPSGGAICFRSNSFGLVDCVEWGSGNNTINAGTPVAGTGIVDGMSIERSIEPGCSTLLQSPQDDTNDSGADFTNTSPTPRNNATAPTETNCVLTVAVSGFGTVTGTGINCPGDCSHPFFNSETVMLTATATNGATFDSWTGCPNAPVGNTCTSPMDVSRGPVTATFTGGSPPTMNPPPAVPMTPATPATPTSTPKKCKKGQKLRKGKCVKKKRKKK
jgi:hypothetical protein